MFIFKLRRSIGAAFAAMAMGVCLVACAQAPSASQPPVASPISELVAQASATANAVAGTKCPEKRAEICPTVHQPVCAQRDTGIRCVRAPCPSEAPVTYSNACAACRDAKVVSYVEGACGAATNLTQ